MADTGMDDAQSNANIILSMLPQDMPASREWAADDGKIITHSWTVGEYSLSLTFTDQPFVGWDLLEGEDRWHGTLPIPKLLMPYKVGSAVDAIRQYTAQ